MTAGVLTRRRALRSACCWCSGMAGSLTGLPALAQAMAGAAAATGTENPEPPRFTRPAIDTDEGGLWAMMDREETRLRRSPFLVRDAALIRYLQEITCALASEHCPDVRVHLVRTPLFNANMAPNGMMQIWTGLLLRVENEAQLVAVLGHEIGHYLERHSLERLRDAKNRAAFAQFLGLFGAVGALGQLGMLAGAFSFSREQEARADRLGMRLMLRAGYDGRQAALVWDNLLAELRVTGGDDVGKRSPMLATHPPVESRRDELLALAGDAPGRTGAQAFRDIVAPHRLSWLMDEIRRGQYEESLALLHRLAGNSPRDAELLFARGEVYRLRNDAGDARKSIEDLQQAVDLGRPPALAFRSLGLVHKQMGESAQARGAFEKYLAELPDAADSGLIRHYVTELTP